MPRSFRFQFWSGIPDGPAKHHCCTNQSYNDSELTSVGGRADEDDLGGDGDPEGGDTADERVAAFDGVVTMESGPLGEGFAISGVVDFSD